MALRLPQPIGRQKEVLCLPAEGHTVVLGTAGSGKTTLAILRAAYLADPKTDHRGKTLLVTFNRALVAYLRHLQDRALRDVVVENYHTFARGYLNSRGKMSRDGICSDLDQRRKLIASAIRKVAGGYEQHLFFERPVELFSEEIRWLAQHGITELDDYEAMERVGRSGARIERKLRKHVLEIRDEYLAKREAIGKRYDWDDLATATREELEADGSSRRYRHVVIDEGQDFSPEMTRSLAAAIPTDGSLTFFGDVAQQIYGHRMSWRSAGLNIAKVWEFKENYRNSKQIARLALAIAQMPNFPDDADLVEPTTPTADGPLPAIVSCPSERREIAFVAKRAARRAQTETVAVLLRDREQEQALTPLLPAGATRLHRQLTRWPTGPGLFYGTYHSAKGLEFDAVYLPHVSRGRLPYPPDVETFGDDEAAAQDSRLLYVAVTRAKSTLVITYTGEPTPLLPDDEGLYQRSER